LGIQGFSSPQYKAVIKEDLVKMKPNLVVIGYYENDTLETASFDSNRKYMFMKSIPDMLPFKVSQLLKRNSHLYLMLLTRYYTAVESLNVDIVQNEAEESHGWEVTKKDFREIKSLADKHNIKVILVGIPSSTKEIKEKQLSESRTRELTSIAEENGFTYYELYNDLMKYKSSLGKLYLDDFNDHFSIVGNEYVAGLLANFLRTKSIIPSI
ncbi:MAG: hypothetical protein AAB656_00030, partial [Patescibacteria group bacterium]